MSWIILVDGFLFKLCHSWIWQNQATYDCTHIAYCSKITTIFSGNCTSFGSQMPHFQRLGQTRHTFTIRPTDFFYSHVEPEEVAPVPAFLLQAFLWSSLPKHLKRLQLAECQITDSQIVTLIRALDNHEAIEVSGWKVWILKISVFAIGEGQNGSTSLSAYPFCTGLVVCFTRLTNILLFYIVWPSHWWYMGLFDWQTLELNDNQITSAGARAIFTWLKACQLSKCLVVVDFLLVTFNDFHTSLCSVWYSEKPVIARTSTWKQ